MCPSDPTNPKLFSQDGPSSGNDQGFHGNYVLCAGNTAFGTTSTNSAQLNGISFPLSAIRPLVPGGTTVAWLGMFENLERARNHFALLIPLTAAIIFGLLLITFRSLPSALLVLAGIPFACVGALVALWLRDMHVNVSTGVGFCALFGIAIMDGVLMVRGTAGVIPLE